MMCPRSVLLAALFVAGGSRVVTFPSPDQGVLAEIRAESPTNCESTIVVHDRQGMLAEANHVSFDHDHGQCVRVAKWTRDSQFFVYLLDNAGGHQGWHTQIWVVSRATRRLMRIEDPPDTAVTAFDFRLFGDHSIEFEAGRIPEGNTRPHIVRMDLKALERTAPPVATPSGIKPPE